VLNQAQTNSIADVNQREKAAISSCSSNGDSRGVGPLEGERDTFSRLIFGVT
jgi:hypothetical protein